MSERTSGTRTVRCPACAGPSLYAESNPWRPFCSERCRHHDLGAWASESYRVAAHPEPDNGLPDAAPSTPRSD
jgi:uncharacterized protein